MWVGEREREGKREGNEKTKMKRVESSSVLALLAIEGGEEEKRREMEEKKRTEGACIRT